MTHRAMTVSQRPESLEFDASIRSLDTQVIFRVDFNNFMARSIQRRLMQGPDLPDVTSATFFKVSATDGVERRPDQSHCSLSGISICHLTRSSNANLSHGTFDQEYLSAGHRPDRPLSRRCLSSCPAGHRGRVESSSSGTPDKVLTNQRLSSSLDSFLRSTYCLCHRE